MNSPLIEFGQLLTTRRKELNIKQEDLAEMTRVALRTVRDIEKGKGNPSFDTLNKLMALVGIELSFSLRK